MNSKNALLIGTLLLTGLYACKKEKDEIPAPTPTGSASTNYAPLTTGSYWIYDTYTLDTNGVETYVSTDSCYIGGDSVIGGNTYAVQHGGVIPSGIYCLRDSSGYLVDQYGRVLFSSTNFADTINYDSLPGYFYAFSKMLAATSVTVPAGTFSAPDCKTTVNIVQPGYMWDTQRFTHNFYADNVGLIYDTYFFLSSPDYRIRKLVRYHIQQVNN